MRELIEQLCSEECAGRAPGTPGGLAARRLVVGVLRAAGLDPYEQPIAGCGGANVLAKICGDADRYVLVGAHFDHLGRHGAIIAKKLANAELVLNLDGGGGVLSEVLADTDIQICVPSARASRIQEVHLLTIHCLCDGIDAMLLGDE